MQSLLEPAARTCRDVAFALVGGLWIGRSTDAVEEDLRKLSSRDQWSVTALVLMGLFLFSLLAAQLGLLGLCLFWLAVIAIIR